MPHLIQKQAFEISASSLRLAQRWESNAQALVHDVITPCLERCFDEVDVDGMDILVDRLEIEMGVLYDGTSREEITERVMSATMRALRGLGTTPRAGGGTSKHEALNDSSAPSVRQGSRRELDGSEALGEIFLYFLRRGRLPWWADAVPDDVAWIESVTSNQLNELKGILKDDHRARDRVVHHFGLEVIQKLGSLLAPRELEDATRGWRHFEGLASQRGAAWNSVRVAYWTYWLHRFSGSDAEIGELVRQVRRWLDEDPTAMRAAQDFVRNERSIGPGIEAGAGRRTVTLDVLAAALSSRLELERETEHASSDYSKSRRQDDGRNPDREPGEALSEEFEASSEERVVEIEDVPAFQLQEEEKALFVEDAGLVLFHPFLSELFTAAGLWTGEDWSGDQARHVAVHLTSWLAHGENSQPEYRMLLPKLLCGFPWEDVLDTYSKPNNHQLGAAEDLIQAVIGHWSALGNVSAEGLQEGFVRRAGKLTEVAGGWRLAVETKAQDVLLSKLPWAVSVVHLPWLPRMRIHVDWA